jgi:hypothetical protein
MGESTKESTPAGRKRMSEEEKYKYAQRQREIADGRPRELEAMWPNGQWYPVQFAPINPKCIDIVRCVHSISTQ